MPWMTGTAMMIALTLVLANTPLGLLRMPFLTATTLHIPVLIACWVLGLEAGVITGLVFGGCSLINNLTGASFFAPFFINPLVSVLPRALFALCAYALSKALRRMTARVDPRGYLACVLTCALATLAHTAMVMGTIDLLYHGQIAQMLVSGAGVPDAIARHGVGWGIAVIGFTNGIPEAIVAAVIAPVVCMALERAMGRSIIRK